MGNELLAVRLGTEHGPYPRKNPYLGFGGSSRGTRLHPVDTLVQSFQYPHDAHRHDAHRDGASDHRLIQSLVILARVRCTGSRSVGG
jgi:hypothetical protein